ncbi:transcriptional regulator FilR1 domain-containing protein [Natranaeroarchaeum sulfidigenes]|uniref:Transcriptional regulator, contains HTH domain n=1 Tax=Natranaeroarchaeum sulfidigenes TaxID=2784880 RepID=A0A897N0K4_9EURY|nr:hypothetical protein [Natranaeroarchaeum sulfidigenes]QSG04185.1 Transcriptional regulator, contains HTH domain [Natranaeroarchaeum sulfidigenes]
MPPKTALVGFLEHTLDTSLDKLEATTTITGPEPTPAEQLRSLVVDADAAVGVLPTLPTSLLDSAGGIDGLRASVVLTGAARERLDGPALAVVESRLTDTSVTLYSHDGDSPAGLVLLDETAVCVEFDTAGEPTALVVSRAPELRAWVAETCSRYQDEADVLVG